MAEIYLVTGGAGFIGSHLVDRLLAEGASVKVLDSLSTGDIGNLEAALPHIDFIEGDLRDSDDVAQACSNVDVVVHLGKSVSASRGPDPALIDPRGVGMKGGAWKSSSGSGTGYETRCTA